MNDARNSFSNEGFLLSEYHTRWGAGEQNLFTAQPWWVPSKPGITVLIGTIAAVWLAPGRSSHVCIASNLLWAFVMSCLALIDEQARLCGSCSYMS